VTGALGCIGAWTLHHLTRRGTAVVAFDLADDRHRLDLLLSPGEQSAIRFVRGDLTEFDEVLAAIRTHGVTHIIHLGALQVPFCKADPVRGAQVNVTGTVNIFEAARHAGIRHLAFASSVAVYGPPELYPARPPVPCDAALSPRTLYGVYKQANEGTARVYWQDHGIGSTALRPYTVYGIGRDQGLTSEPTKAMLAAAAGQAHHVSFGGRMQFQLASDVAHRFIDAAEHPLEGAHVFNFGTAPTAVSDLVAMIREARPGAAITCGDTPLPFPEAFDEGGLARRLPARPETPLAEGVRRTIEQFEACLRDGRIRIDSSRG